MDFHILLGKRHTLEPMTESVLDHGQRGINSRFHGGVVIEVSFPAADVWHVERP